MSKPKYIKYLRRATILMVFLLLLVFSVYYNSNGEIRGVEVSITDPDVHFIDQQSVLDYLQTKGMLRDDQVQKSQIKNVEQILKTSFYIDSAEAYVTKGQHLRIVVKQMQPLARVFLSNNIKSFYLKSNNQLIPVSPDYTARVPVVTGFQYVVKDSSYRADFVEMMRYITADSFWSACIPLMDIDRKGDISLYPIIGDHTVLLGKPRDFIHKLTNLNQFYKQVLNKQGFDLYRNIDIRFRQQVVASPSVALIDTNQKTSQL